MPNADHAVPPLDSQYAVQLANQLWGWFGSGDGRITWKKTAKKKVFDDLKDDAQTVWA